MANNQQSEQIGCGYCIHEKDCKKRDPKVNKAKLGCEDYQHFKLNNTKKLNHVK